MSVSKIREGFRADSARTSCLREDPAAGEFDTAGARRFGNVVPAPASAEYHKLNLLAVFDDLWCDAAIGRRCQRFRLIGGQMRMTWATCVSVGQ